MISASDLPSGSKSAAFSAANRKTRQRVLENLFETEELNDTGIYVFLETETAFVWPDCAVELATVTGVRMDFAVVIFPDNAECKHPFRFDHTIQEIVFFVFRMTFYNRIRDDNTSSTVWTNSGSLACFVLTFSITDARYLFIKLHLI